MWNTNLFSGCYSYVGGISEGGLSQDFLVLLGELRLGRSRLFSLAETRALRDVSGGTEARALRHGPATEELAHHGQTARTLGNNAAVSAYLGAGLLQRRQKAHPVHSVLVHLACSRSVFCLVNWRSHVGDADGDSGWSKLGIVNKSEGGCAPTQRDTTNKNIKMRERMQN